MKYVLNVVQCYDGTEVVFVSSTEYIHTVYDDIIADWRRQHSEELKRQRKKEVSVKGILRKLIK